MTVEYALQAKEPLPTSFGSIGSHRAHKHLRECERICKWKEEPQSWSVKGLSLQKEIIHLPAEVGLVGKTASCHSLTDVADILGRVCMQFGSNTTTLSCCLPCPVFEWIYSDDFAVKARSANTIAIIALILEAFVLLTYMTLPEEEHHQDYLSVGLTISLMLVAAAFIAPLATSLEPCHNAITPNDFHTNATCAVSGMLLEIGAMGCVVWSPRLSHTSMHVPTNHVCSSSQINTDGCPDHSQS